VEVKFATANTKLTLNVFASYLQQFISSIIDTTLKPRIATSPGVRRMLNIDKVLIAGTEVSINQVITSFLKANIDVAYVYGQNLDSKSPLPEIPPLDLRLSLIGSMFSSTLQPEVSLRYVTSQDRIAAEVGEAASPEFTLIDAGVTYKINKYLRASAGVQNIFDVAYYEHLSRVMKTTPPKPLYAPGRNVYLSLNFSLL
jgi:iron complex outermembrane receptor protein